MAKSLSGFRKKVNKNAEVRVYCPRCTEEMTFGNFYRYHVTEKHGLTRYNRCVLCFGEFVWTRDDNDRHGEHLHACLNSFLDSNRVRIPSVVDAEEEIAPNLPPERRIEYVGLASCSLPPSSTTGFDTDSRFSGGFEEFYGSELEKPEMWCGEPGVRFHERTGLGPDIHGIFRRYLRGDLKWFHLMVKFTAYVVFSEKTRTIRHSFVALPYGCLCDGLKSEDGGRRVVHRHLIVACDPDGPFEKVMRYEVRQKPSEEEGTFRAKLCVRIKSALHLAQTIVYVSRPNATCDRGIPDDCFGSEEGRAASRSPSHFHLFRPLVEQAVAFVCTLFPYGIRDLLQVHNRHKDVVDWKDRAYRWGDRGRWAVPIEATNWKFLNHVVLVARDLEPCEEETDSRLYFFDETPRFYERNPDLLQMSDEEWESRQIERENTFRRIRDRPYVLSRMQQNAMNQIRRVEKTKDEFWKTRLSEDALEFRRKLFALEGEKESLKSETETIRSRFESVSREKDDLKRRLVVSESESRVIRRKCLSWKRRSTTALGRATVARRLLATVREENETLKSRVATLETEKSVLSSEKSVLSSENEALKSRLATVETESSLLRSENEALKRRVSELERRLLESEIESLRSELSATKSRLAWAESRLAVVEPRLAEVERENARLKEEMSILRIEAMEEKWKKENERLQAQSNAFQTQLNASQIENERLRKQLDLLQSESVTDKTSEAARFSDSE